MDGVKSDWVELSSIGGGVFLEGSGIELDVGLTKCLCMFVELQWSARREDGGMGGEYWVAAMSGDIVESLKAELFVGWDCEVTAGEGGLKDGS